MPIPVFDFSGSKRPTEFGRIAVPDDDWLALQADEEVLLPDLPIIDPHHHLWEYPGYRYLVSEFSRDIGSGHNVVATVYVECVSMYREAGPTPLKPLGEIEFAVGQHAQSESGQYGAGRTAEGIIGFADLTLGAAVEDVLTAELEVSNGRFKGIRFSTSWDPAPEIIGSPNDDRAHVLREAPVREGLKTLGRMGLTFDAWLFFTQHDEFIEAVDAAPDTVFVLDHCGGPLGYGPYARNKPEHYAAWRAGILEIAKRPNVACKVGGILGRGAAFDYLHAERPAMSEELADLWRPWFEPTIEAFGADRCMFESNFPLERMGTSYAALWNCFKRTAANASEGEKRALFAGTADRVYRMGRGYARA